MADQPGDLVRSMANMPPAATGTTGKDVKENVKENVKEKDVKPKGLLAVLGSPQFVAGDGKRYPRTTGFGSSRKPHPDGGTNETVAWIIFKPFSGLDLTMEGRIYCERFKNAAGEDKREYSISLPMLKAERKDAKGKGAIESLKIQLRDLYRSSELAKAVAKGVTVEKAMAADRWTDD